MASMIAKPEDLEINQVLLSHPQLLPKMTAMKMTFQINQVDIRSIIMEKMALRLCIHRQALDKEMLRKYVHLVEASSELLEIQERLHLIYVPF